MPHHLCLLLVRLSFVLAATSACADPETGVRSTTEDAASAGGLSLPPEAGATASSALPVPPAASPPEAGVPGGPADTQAGVDAAPSPTIVEPKPVPADAARVSDTARVDAAPARPDGPGAPANGRLAAGAVACSEVVGLQITGEWFNGGFEKVVDGKRWQLKSAEGSTLEKWESPTDKVWDTKIASPCEQASTGVERILFQPYSTALTGVERWTQALTKVIANLRARYPMLRQVELVTMTRGPGNKSCGGKTSSVPAHVEPAIAAVAAQSGGFVLVGPRPEVPDCSMFGPDGAGVLGRSDHLTAEGNAYIGKQLGDLYR